MKAVVGFNVSSNSSAVIIRQDGKWCALEEERFTRIKKNKDPARQILGFRGAWFPESSFQSAMDYLGVTRGDLERCAFACTGEFSTRPGIRLVDYVQKEVPCEVLQISHHLAHAWSVNDGQLQDGDLILVCDGSGSRVLQEAPTDNSGWERLSAFVVFDGALRRALLVTPRYYYSPKWDRLVRSINSLGFFYEWLASRCVPVGNELEGSMMALAAFGADSPYKDLLLSYVDLFSDGSYLLRLNDLASTDMKDSWPNEFPDLCIHAAFENERERADLAWAAQFCFEQIVMNSVMRLHSVVKPKLVAVAGGCFLNCVVNGKLEALLGPERLILRPAMHDAGVAFGCAMAALTSLGWNLRLDPNPSNTAAAGISELSESVESELKVASQHYHIQNFADSSETAVYVAKMLNDGRIVGVFAGRSEFGPRALGNRSIIASPSSATMRSRLNQLKRRAAFRPFALSVLQSRTVEVFGRSICSPFMLQCFPVTAGWRAKLAEGLHIDGTTRIQTVTQRDSLYPLLIAFEHIAGVPAVINTSLNMKSEPIVLYLREAIRACVDLGLDALCIDLKAVVHFRI